MYIHNCRKILNLFCIELYNLQVGNGVTDQYYDNIGSYEYWWSHGLISDETYHALNKCATQASDHTSAACDAAADMADKEQGNIDPYSIYTPPCNNSGSLRRNRRGRHVLFSEPLCRLCFTFSLVYSLCLLIFIYFFSIKR